MNSLFLLFSFILGTVIGSFLNVVALRYNTGMTVKGRSKCFSCNKVLSWIELVPLFSFIFQGGVCTKCKGKISWQYPVIELLSGLLFILIFYFFPPVSIAAGVTTIFYLLVTSILLVIVVYDVKHKIIPDTLVYTFALISLAHLFISPDLGFQIPDMIDLIAGPIVALPFAALWLVSKGTWMGLGDAKLALGIGWTLGLIPAVSAIVFAFWIGAVVSVVWMLLVFRKLKARYEIPFGPYLILGMYIVLFTAINAIDITSFFLKS